VGGSEEHHREVLEAENNYGTAIVGTPDGPDDKGKSIH